MLRGRTVVENDTLSNPDYIACYICYAPLTLNTSCWFVKSPLLVPRKEGTFRPYHGTQYAVCCSEECVELAFIALM
jgi:hypothetical protein